jgi:poly-gamma-glutamate capsule biosynthesis protein CapA/YwtB (metallophosphatase superfamily)
MNLIPTFTYEEETDLMAAVFSGVALMKQYAEESETNKDYWMKRAETYQRLGERLSGQIKVANLTK